MHVTLPATSTPSPAIRGQVGSEVVAADPATSRAMRVAGTAIAVILAVVLAVLLWAIRRGVDVTDEGLYHLEYAHPRPDPYFFSQYDVLVGLAFGPFRPSILLLRFLRLGLELGSSAILAYGTTRFLRAGLPRVAPLAPFWLLWVSASAFALASHTWLPETPAYNTFTAALVATLLGLAFGLGGALPPPAIRMVAVAMGVALTLLLFVKWSAALPMLVVVVALVLTLRGVAPGIRDLGWSAFGAAATLLLATSIGPFGGFDLPALRDANTSFGGVDTHSPSAAVERYLDSIVADLTAVRTGWTLIALGAFAALFVLSQLRLPGWVLVAAASAATAGLAYGCVIQLRGSTSFLGVAASPSVLLVVLFGLAAGLLVASGRLAWLRRARSGRPPDRVSAERLRRWVPVVLVVAALGGAPVLASVGTSNVLLSQVLVAAAPLGVLLVVGVAALVVAAPRGAALAATGLVLAVLLVATQTLNGRLFQAYRSTTTLADQTVSLAGVPGYEGILVDPQVAGFVRRLRGVVAERTAYEPGDPVLVLTKGAGLVSFLDGAPAGPAWLASPWDDQRPNCRAIESASDELEHATLVLVTDDPVASELDACVAASFSAWPDGVEAVATIDYPFSRPTGQAEVVRVYAVR